MHLARLTLVSKETVTAPADGNFGLALNIINQLPWSRMQTRILPVRQTRRVTYKPIRILVHHMPVLVQQPRPKAPISLKCILDDECIVGSKDLEVATNYLHKYNVINVPMPLNRSEHPWILPSYHDPSRILIHRLTLS